MGVSFLICAKYVSCRLDKQLLGDAKGAQHFSLAHLFSCAMRDSLLTPCMLSNGGWPQCPLSGCAVGLCSGSRTHVASGPLPRAIAPGQAPVLVSFPQFFNFNPNFIPNSVFDSRRLLAHRVAEEERRPALGAVRRASRQPPSRHAPGRGCGRFQLRETSAPTGSLTGRKHALLLLLLLLDQRRRLRSQAGAFLFHGD